MTKDTSTKAEPICYWGYVQIFPKKQNFWICLTTNICNCRMIGPSDEFAASEDLALMLFGDQTIVQRVGCRYR